MNRAPLGTARIVIFFVVIATCVPALTQEPKPTAHSDETTTSESTFKIHAERNLVVVRVVVRDASGKAVTGLRKGDFRLLDNGKAQGITGFSVESPEAKTNPATAGSATQPPPAAGPEAEHPVVMPDRFVALFFDDIHISFEDLVRTRDAAVRYISSNLQPADRVALFTASGDSHLDFTADHDKLHDVLLRIRQHPMPASQGNCPEIAEYQAYQISELHDPTAIQVAQADALVECCGGQTHCSQQDANYLETESRQILTDVEFSSRYVFQSLESLARRMATQPGQRSVVFLSPGFFTDTETFELQEVIDRALRSGVVINTLDARGLYVDLPLGDASQRVSGDLRLAGLKSQIHSESMLAQTGVLASLASGTGGVYFHDSNDYDAGFRRTGGLPEASYVLTFSPQNLKYDGAFHKLKVTLANPSKLTLQARLGYYAPRKAEDAATQAKDEIEEAIFSRNEIRELPVDVSTRFFKTDSLNAKLSVVAHVDMSSIHFQKAQDRHLGNMTLDAALFDSDGNYLARSETKYEMRLLDRTLKQVEHTGVFLRANLNVKVGTYFMRVVVRDAESSRMSTVNQTVEIPY